MKNKYHNTILLLLLLVGIGNTAMAQVNFEIGQSRDNSMAISGTSTFHDWTMKTKTFTGSAQFSLIPGNDIKGLNSLEFSLPVLQLKSSKRALDKNARKALKADKFKYITYTLTKAAVVGEKEYKFQIATTGNLTVAGVTKEVTIDIYCMANKNGSITCTGKYKLKMTDYNVEPPSFMGGLMSTGETITLDFSMRFER
jgi:polyisoprenoid-binding protein YceI